MLSTPVRARKDTILKQKDDAIRLTDTGEVHTASAPAACGRQLPDLDRMMASYGDVLLRICFIYLKDIQLAEDAVQDTFLKAYNNYGQFDGGRGEKTWITRIAINVCKDMLRSAWNRRVNVVGQLADIPGTAGPTAEAGADETLIKTVMNLKPRYKEVVLLFYYEDMKIADIAKVLDAPESTISVRLKRARELLKKELGGWYYDEE